MRLRDDLPTAGNRQGSYRALELRNAVLARLAADRAGRGVRAAAAVVLVLLVACLVVAVLLVTSSGHSATASAAHASHRVPASELDRAGQPHRRTR